MNNNERRLILLLALLLAVIGGITLSRKFISWQKQLAGRELELSFRQSESATLLREADVWKARGAWLTEHQPVLKTRLDAESDLFNTLRDRAQNEGLTITNNQLQEPQKNDAYNQFGVTLTVKGNLASVFRWIYGVQSPTDFRVVPYLKITPDKDDDKKVVCAVQFWRWYQPVNTKS